MPITSNMVVAGKGNRATRVPTRSPARYSRVALMHHAQSRPQKFPVLGPSTTGGNDAPGTVPTEQTHAASG